MVVSSPYTFIPSFGTYNFTCVVSDQQNYTPSSVEKTLTVTTGGYGCTNPDTYAFQKTINPTGTLLNLNFTSLVNSHYVKDDLSDVWVNTSLVDAWKNTTSGYYLVVNVTGVDSFVVKFGNYIGNQSYSNHALSENTTDITGYEEINGYYFIDLRDEKSNSNLLPPDATNTISLFCSGGVSSFVVNDTQLLVSTFEELDEIKATVAYSSTEIYYRNLLVSAPVEYKKLYLVDANQHQVLQVMIKMQDNTGNFGNAVFRAKKYLEGTLETITELNFDAENKVIVYLVNGDKYSIYVDNGVEERNIGYLYADSSDLEKTLVIGGLVTTNQTIMNTTFDLSYDGETISLSWSDEAGLTTEIEFWVYNYTSGEELYYASSANHSFVNFNYNVPSVNETYKVKYKIHHAVYGEHTFGETLVMFGEKDKIIPIFPLNTLVSNLGGDTVLWLALLFILPIPMLFSEKHAKIGALMLLGAVALFAYWKMYEISAMLLSIGLLIVFMIFIVRRRSE